MIQAPNDLDSAHVMRVQSLLDSFAKAAVGNLGLHESTCKHLAYIVADWAQRNKHRIETEVVTSHHRTYEVWHIRILGAVYEGSIAIWPEKIGLLDGKDELRNKIEAIRKAADEQVKHLLDLEQSRAVQP